MQATTFASTTPAEAGHHHTVMWTKEATRRPSLLLLTAAPPLSQHLAGGMRRRGTPAKGGISLCVLITGRRAWSTGAWTAAGLWSPSRCCSSCSASSPGLRAGPAARPRCRARNDPEFVNTQTRSIESGRVRLRRHAPRFRLRRATGKEGSRCCLRYRAVSTTCTTVTGRRLQGAFDEREMERRVLVTGLWCARRHRTPAAVHRGSHGRSAFREIRPAGPSSSGGLLSTVLTSSVRVLPWRNQVTAVTCRRRTATSPRLHLLPPRTFRLRTRPTTYVQKKPNACFL